MNFIFEKNFQLIVSGILIVLYLLIKLIKFFINLKKAKKNKQFKLIEEQLLLFIQEAETLFNNGIIKKEFVLESINDFLNKNHIKLDTSFIENKIEEIINISKSINYNGESNE